MEMQVSIVIVNYNGLQYLEGCISSLNQNLKGISHEIIIVDNNSDDGSCAFIKSAFPNVILIESPVNLGFGRGNNEGFKNAKGKYILLINNDTIILDRLNPMIELLERDKSIGVIGINMLNSQRQYLSACGNFPSVASMIQFKKLFLIDEEFLSGRFKNAIYDVDWLTGSFLMMPREVYQRVGGFDTDYFMYVEDVDLCKKIANLGYRRVFIPNLNYIHFVGFSSSRNKMLIKGYQIYVRKQMNGLTATLSLAVLKLKHLIEKLNLRQV